MRFRVFVAVAVAVALVGTVGFAQGQGRYRLGGSWIGKEAASGPGHLWTCIQAPLDSDARAASLRVKFTTYGPDLVGLLTAFGADSVSDFVGEAQMFNRDTSQFTLVGYAQKQGNPPQVRAILVTVGTWQFIDPDHAVLNYTVSVYPAAFDADHDGMPDPGFSPVAIVPVMDTAQRVAIVQ